VLSKLVRSGEIDPDATVVANITGNGLKTLEDHPEKGWPLAECEAEAMLSVLRDFQHEQSAVPA
jgi:threonine synthase